MEDPQHPRHRSDRPSSAVPRQQQQRPPPHSDTMAAPPLPTEFAYKMFRFLGDTHPADADCDPARCAEYKRVCEDLGPGWRVMDWQTDVMEFDRQDKLGTLERALEESCVAGPVSARGRRAGRGRGLTEAQVG